jgi:hypothetical protein
MITAEIDRYGERDYSRKRAGKPSLEYYLLSTWVSVASQDNHFSHHRRGVVATPKCKHARLVGDEGDSGEFATLDGEIDVIALDDGVMHCAMWCHARTPRACTSRLPATSPTFCTCAARAACKTPQRMAAASGLV